MKSGKTTQQLREEIAALSQKQKQTAFEQQLNLTLVDKAVNESNDQFMHQNKSSQLTLKKLDYGIYPQNDVIKSQQEWQTQRSSQVSQKSINIDKKLSASTKQFGLQYDVDELEKQVRQQMIRQQLIQKQLESSRKSLDETFSEKLLFESRGQTLRSK
ncbi:Hypothetical_protein [Hexamita inflata]|uniref:Hypothetical_protein n=1 Tax=Hexamita inflata TaxID=28002 RepID=A0AA86TVF5_9EUKA|nr:Hypothetical protein HINF_LOCUS16262 [Hexamita inflata]